MSAIAIALAEMGHTVSGSDFRDQPVLDRVRAAGVVVHVGHDADIVVGCDAVTSSTAIPAHNVELAAARELGIPTLRRAGMLAADLRPGPLDRRRRHPRQDDDDVDADADPRRRRAGAELHRRRRRHGRRHRRPLDGRRRCSSSRPTRATAPTSSCRWPARSCSTSSSTSSSTTARSRPCCRASTRYVAQIDGPEGAVRRRPGVRRAGRPPRRHHVRPRRRRPTCGPSTCASHDGSFSFAVERRGADGRRRAARHRSSCRCAGCTTSSTRPAPSPWRSSSARTFEDCRAALARFGGVARRFDIRGVDGGATFVDDYGHLPGRDRRRHRRGPRQRRRVAARHRRLPAQPLQPHRRDVARLRRRVRRRRRRRDHRHLPVGHDADPGRHRQADRQRRRRRPPAGARRVAAPTRRRRVVPGRRGRSGRRVHLDGVRRHRHAARRDPRPPRRRGGRRDDRRPTSPPSTAAARVLGPRATRDEPLGPHDDVPRRRPGGAVRAGPDARRPRSPSPRPAGRRGCPCSSSAGARTCSSPTPGFAGIAVSVADARRRHRPRRRSAARSVPAGGGVALPVLARRTAAAGLTGFEWAVGVPGTVGGAVRMNAGGHGSDIAAVPRRRRRCSTSTTPSPAPSSRRPADARPALPRLRPRRPPRRRAGRPAARRRRRPRRRPRRRSPRSSAGAASTSRAVRTAARCSSTRCPARSAPAAWSTASACAATASARPGCRRSTPTSSRRPRAARRPTCAP